MARRAKDPRGGEWVVRRRWLERRRRLRGAALTRNQRYHSGQSAAFILFLPFGIAWLLLTLADLVRESLAHLGGKPWIIEAKLDALKQERLRWRVAGWSHSRQAIHEIVAALSRGDELTRFGEPESELASYGETRR
jgi:hypothetical protein